MSNMENKLYWNSNVFDNGCYDECIFNSRIAVVYYLQTMLIIIDTDFYSECPLVITLNFIALECFISRQ